MARSKKTIGQVVQNKFHRSYEQGERQEIEIVVARTTSAGTPTVHYTVSSDKILYIETIYIVVVNDINLIGEFHIRDDGTVKIPLLTKAKSVGTNSDIQVFPINFEDNPLKFSTNFESVQISGANDFTLIAKGYEE